MPTHELSTNSNLLTVGNPNGANGTPEKRRSPRDAIVSLNETPHHQATMTSRGARTMDLSDYASIGQMWSGNQSH